MSIFLLRPSAVGSSQGNANHTPVGDTPNWKCVDEVSADEDTTYCENNQTGISVIIWSDRYVFQQLATVASIVSVEIFVRARYSILNGNAQVATHVRTNNVNYFGTLLIPTIGFLDYSTLRTVNPNTGLAWTKTNLNSAQFGFQTKVSGDGVNATGVRSTQVWISVITNEALNIPVLPLGISIPTNYGIRSTGIPLALGISLPTDYTVVVGAEVYPNIEVIFDALVVLALEEYALCLLQLQEDALCLLQLQEDALCQLQFQEDAFCQLSMITEIEI